MESDVDKTSWRAWFQGPRGLLTFALALSLILVFVLVAFAASTWRSVDTIAATHIRAERNAANIVRYHEGLSSSARLAVASGDPHWEAVYRETAAALDEAIATARELADTGELPDSAIRGVDSASRVMTSLENRAFLRLSSGRTLEAESLLSGTTYLQNKRRYQDSIEEYAAAIRDSTTRRVESTRQRARNALLLCLGIAVVTGLCTRRLFRNLGNWNLREEARERAALRVVDERRLADLGDRELLINQLVRAAPVSLFAVDSSGVFTYGKGTVIDSDRIGRRRIVGANVAQLYEHRPQIVDSIHQALAGDTVFNTLELSDEVSYQAAYTPTFDGSGHLSGMVGVYTDISSILALQRQLEHRTRHDPLTGLANREAFTAAMHRLAGSSCTIMIVGIDGFKDFNDAAGHDAGNQVLIQLANRLQSCVRARDFVARLGGDEFGVLVEATDEQHCQQLADRFLLAAAVPIEHPSGIAELTVSIGMAVVAPDQSIDESLQDADLALMSAKRAGKNRSVIFRSSMRDAAVEYRKLKSELERALLHDELRLVYQPMWSFETGQIRGVEALVRWQHPDRGLLSPAAFLPIAEELRIIPLIDEWVLERACEQTQHWRTELHIPDLWCSVNISALDFASSDVVEIAERALRRSGLHSNGLVLEITETAVMENVGTTLDALSKLHGMGVRIALDDFGAGYSSFGQLHQLSIDVLKVDRMFVTDGSDASAFSVAETIVSLGKNLGLRVVAEGIETRAQLETMNEVGCDLAQGYLLARPVPADECTQLLRRPTAALSARFLH